MIDGKYEYYAFISYNHKDKKWAKWLEKKLESYSLPTALRKENSKLPDKIRPVFRDNSELSCGKLKPEIKKNLDKSKYLIVICSPHSAQSQWVSDEVQYFIDQEKEEYIIPFIIGGTPNAAKPEDECFPGGLRQLTGENELLGININEMGRDAAAIKVIARMFDLRFDALWQRHERAKRKKNILRISTLLLFLAISLGVLFWISWLYRNSEKELGKVMALSIYSDRNQIGKYQAIDSLKQLAYEKPYSPQIEKSLRFILEDDEMPLAILPTRGDVKSIAFNPLENKFLVGGTDGYLRYIDATDGHVHWIENIRYKISNISFIDNKICYYSHDNCLGKIIIDEDSILNIPKSDEIKWGNGGYIIDIDCKKINGNELIAVSSSKGEVFVKDGISKYKLPPQNSYFYYNTYVSIHPSTRSIVYGSHGIITRYDLDSNETKWEKRLSPSHNSSICFSHNGNYIFVGNYDGEISVLDFNSGEILCTLSTNSNALNGKSINDILISTDDRFLYCCSEDSHTYQFDLMKWELSRKWGGHYRFVYAVASSSDGEYLATGGEDDNIVLYSLNSADVESNKIDSIKIAYSYIEKMEWGNHDEIIAKSNDRYITVYNLSNNKTTRKKATRGYGNSFTLNNNQIICWDSISYSKINVYASTLQRITKSIELGTKFYYDIYYYHNKLILYSGNKYVIYDISRKSFVDTIKLGNYATLEEPAHCDRDNNLFISQCVINGIFGLAFFNTRTCELQDISIDKRFPNNIIKIDVSPNKEYLATCGRDKNIWIWDYNSKLILYNIEAHDNVLSDISFSPNSKYIASTSSDGTLKIWDVESGMQIAPTINCKNDITQVLWNSIGDRLYWSDNKGNLYSKEFSSWENIKTK